MIIPTNPSDFFYILDIFVSKVEKKKQNNWQLLPVSATKGQKLNSRAWITFGGREASWKGMVGFQHRKAGGIVGNCNHLYLSPIEINQNDQCQWEWITSYDHLLNVMLHLASRSLGQQLHELRTLVAPRLRIIPARTHAAMEEPGREEFMLPSANMEITKDQTMKLYEVMYT